VVGYQCAQWSLTGIIIHHDNPVSQSSTDVDEAQATENKSSTSFRFCRPDDCIRAPALSPFLSSPVLCSRVAEEESRTMQSLHSPRVCIAEDGGGTSLVPLMTLVKQD
jgi:hypothetical protein